MGTPAPELLDVLSVTSGSRSSLDPAEPVEWLLVKPMPVWKRGIDILGAAVGLSLFALPMAVIGIAVKLSSPGPVLFKQYRAGHGGRAFKMYKLRTMVEGAENEREKIVEHNARSGPVFKMRNDPRVTRIGRFLRLSSLDELPQFYNVLIGEMSLVGPRPLPLKEERLMSRWHHARRQVKPGITCIWQASSRDESCLDAWMRLDIRYVRKMSFWLDLKILLLTIPAVVIRRGAIE